MTTTAMAIMYVLFIFIPLFYNRHFSFYCVILIPNIITIDYIERTKAPNTLKISRKRQFNRSFLKLKGKNHTLSHEYHDFSF